MNLESVLPLDIRYSQFKWGRYLGDIAERQPCAGLWSIILIHYLLHQPQKARKEVLLQRSILIINFNEFFQSYTISKGKAWILKSRSAWPQNPSSYWPPLLQGFVMSHIYITVEPIHGRMKIHKGLMTCHRTLISSLSCLIICIDDLVKFVKMFLVNLSMIWTWEQWKIFCVTESKVTRSQQAIISQP